MPSTQVLNGWIQILTKSMPNRIYLLLDECVYDVHAQAFDANDFYAFHTSDAGWNGMSNGTLINKATEYGVDVILTEDKGFVKKRTKGIWDMGLSIFVIADPLLIASNLPEVIPNISARLRDGIDKPLYVMGARKGVKKVVHGLPRDCYEIVSPNYPRE